MKNRDQLIQLLADGQFHSGEEIAERFGISRAAVWKKLSKLKQDLGLEIFAVRGKGYALRDAIDLLSEDRLHEHLRDETKRCLSRVELFTQIESTNAYLMQLAREGARTGAVCLSEQQSGGRGRLGREWVSPFGSNIYLSILWRFMLAPADLGGLSLAAGVGVTRSLKELGVEGVTLKWPNDVLHQERKLAGLLMEMGGEQSGPSYVVLGLGLNVNMSEDQGVAIDQPWVSLNTICDSVKVGRNQLAASLINQLSLVFKQYEEGGLAPLLNEWRQHDGHHGKAVVLQIGNRTVEGIHEGVDDSGALLIRIGQKVRSFHGGEVSLRPL